MEHRSRRFNVIYIYFFFDSQSELILAQQINWTLKGEFHIGTTPPLATMIYSMAARWTGYQGSESILYAGQ